MYLLNKSFHPVNCTFARRASKKIWSAPSRRFTATITGTADDVYRISVSSPGAWTGAESSARLAPLAGASAACTGAMTFLRQTQTPGFELKTRDGRTLLRTLAGEGFGVSGSAWLFQFEQRPGMQFYGMAEKCTPFEKSGRTHRFWNTDAFGDFSGHQIANDFYDPDYISVPYVIIKQGNEYVGILIDNPFPTVIAAARRHAGRGQTGGSAFYLGADDGRPELYVLYGPTLAQLTGKFQALTGRHPLPPLWALGHHQCRWGYRSVKDLHWLADNFEKYSFPVDGLWLDIDYMDGYRVFTFNRKHFPSPAADLSSIHRRGYRVVPIIDPGVKHDPGYAVYKNGRLRKIFCRNTEGGEFIGLVWPGHTAFPDFTLAECRAWWAGLVKKFMHLGIDGAWIDMNDPSTGAIECTGMRFKNGSAPHEAYHNQYASYMAQATREGFLAARPNERPFLISRSGYTGQQKWCGNWTGDNCSNWFHLRHTIGKTLNLALSGMVYNGPDVGGFMGDTNETLMVEWMKACFLFPFSRNHTCTGTRRQEPWAFSRTALRVLRQYVRLRYKLLPYVYNLFIEHERSGAAILRPLFYDFRDSAKLRLGTIDDQFMVGPCIMQAPFLTQEQKKRPVVLPPGRWWRADTGVWLAGNRTVTALRSKQTTPLFLRDGSLVAMQKGVRTNNRNDLKNIELLCVLSAGFGGRASARYCCDDGISFDYRDGKRTGYELTARVKNGTLYLAVTARQKGFGEVAFTPVTVTPFARCVVSIDGVTAQRRCVARRADTFGRSCIFYHWI